MRLRVVAVGRARKGPEAALFARYAARLRPALALDEVETKKPLPPAEQPAAEAALIAVKLAGAERLVILDERGETPDSRALSACLSRWRDDGVRETAFVIGGAYGLTDALRARADWCLAFGPLTWPHLMVRAMLAEQLYRAEAIRLGAPYHHGG